MEKRYNILVAPDKFKGTLSAAEAAGIIAGELRMAFPQANVAEVPMADGGEGTAEILARKLCLEEVSVALPDPLGQPSEAVYYTDGVTAAIDSAAAVGLLKMAARELRPMQSTSYYLGTLLHEILENDGIRRVYLGIGGTATVDGGAGMMQALGMRFRRADGSIISSPVTLQSLGETCSIDFGEFAAKKYGAKLYALADVDVSLAGSMNFASQKGVKHADMPLLCEALNKLERLLGPLSDERHMPSRGAGGGIGFAAGLLPGSHVVAGADYISEIYRLFDKYSLPELIITGEGCIDSQTASGKVVDALYRRAYANGIPVVVFAGRSELSVIPEGMEVITTSAYLRGRELNHTTGAETLREAVRRAISARNWGREAQAQ